MNQSFANSKREYTLIQICRAGDNSLHVQGSGPEVNLEYGVADGFTVSDDVMGWFMTIPTTVRSLASKDIKYVNAQAVVNGEGDSRVVHIQISGPQFNRPYGAALDVPATKVTALTQFVESAA